MAPPGPPPAAVFAQFRRACSQRLQKVSPLSVAAAAVVVAVVVVAVVVVAVVAVVVARESGHRRLLGVDARRRSVSTADSVWFVCLFVCLFVCFGGGLGEMRKRGNSASFRPRNATKPREAPRQLIGQ